MAGKPKKEKFLKCKVNGCSCAEFELKTPGDITLICKCGHRSEQHILKQ